MGAILVVGIDIGSYIENWDNQCVVNEECLAINPDSAIEGIKK